MSDLWTVLLEALRSLVPVGADALRGQLDLLMTLVDDLAQAEVSDFHLSVVEDDVLRLKVVVNDLLFALVQVLQPTQYLRNYKLGLLLGDLPILLQVEVEIWPRAQLKDRTEAVVVDLHGVKLLYDPSVVEVFMDLIFTDGMLNVIILDLL